MPYLFANIHRKDGAATLDIETFMPTHVPEPVDDAAQAAAFFAALDRQIRIADIRNAATQNDG